MGKGDVTPASAARANPPAAAARDRATGGCRAAAPRVLYVRTEGRSTLDRDERRRLEACGRAPRRILIEEAFGFDLLGESDIAAMTGLRGRLLRLLPMFLALACEVARRQRDYDIVVTWAEKYSVAVAAVLCVRRAARRPVHVAIMDWISKPVVRIPLRIVRRGVDRMLTWSSVQADVAVSRIGFDRSQIAFIDHPVDDTFFAPMQVDRRTIFAAGETQRDYETLIEATRPLGIPTVIAASRVGVFTGFRTRISDTGAIAGAMPWVEISGLDAVALRAAYAEARIVVIPLVPAPNNAGISVLLEAMAMGRPVVITRTEGQVDVVRQGETGLYVPPGDPAAMRAAIERLLSDPIAAERMGQRGLREVRTRHRSDDFAARVRELVLDAGRARQRQASS